MQQMWCLVALVLAQPQPEVGRPRPAARWELTSWGVEGLALGGKTPTAGMGASLGLPLGRPSERLVNLATGWVIRPGVEIVTARLSGPSCEPVERNCDVLPFAVRLAAGPTVAIGWAEGELDSTGLARASLLVSASITAFAALHRTDAVPLSPSVAFWDVVVRGRLGVVHPGHVFSLALIAESALLSPLLRGLNMGLAVGVAF